MRKIMINRYNWILEVQSNSHENSCRTDVQKQEHQCGELLEPSPITFCSGVDWASLFQQWDKTSRFKRRRKQGEAASTLHMVKGM